MLTQAFSLMLLAGASLASPPKLIDGQNLISPSDYPKESRTEGEQGRTRVKISVSPSGKQYRCETLTSSGFSSIDKASCRVIMNKARFIHASDESGKPITGLYFMNLNWRVSNSRYPMASTVLPDLVFTVDRIPNGAPYAFLTLFALFDEAGGPCPVTWCNSVTVGA
ncbi:energy transducer TonB [Sphingobium sp. Z007]|uniref:energy transducer TonB n=3 Tax=Sphingobium sp. Z007 TaxID=627495 RepID=UPI000B497A03|nr:energy transducer TonB [Sphingobium sp. Z007]